MMKKLFFSLFICLTISVHSFSQSNNFAGAVLIPTTSTCVTGTNQIIGHTISGATNEATLAITGNGCSSANNTPDVWYKFTTQTEFPIITVTPTGSSFTTDVLKVQILSGTVLTALTQMGCGSNNPAASPVTVVPATPLTPGTTYYVRVSRSTTTLPTGATWGYNICIREGTASRMGEVFKQTILSGSGVLQYPWEITYGPDNNLWVTESRGYKVYKIDPSTGTKATVLDLSSGSTWLTTNAAPAGSDTLAAINTASWNGGWPSGTATNPNWPQGGLAGMALHPQFLDGTGTKDYMYVSYVHRYLSGGGTTNGVVFRNKIVRFTYNTSTQKFSMPVELCGTLPGSNDHNSQRLIIAPVSGTNYLFMAEGDMGAGQFGNRDRAQKAQDITSYEGKILRFNLESDFSTTGETDYSQWIPNDNPYGATSAVWVVGIRNNQGFAYNAEDGILYGTSHGPYSDDELNIIERFKNYGHPLVIGYAADGNYNGTTTGSTNTSVSAGTGFATNSGNSTCPPVGNEVNNQTTLNSVPVSSVKGLYKDPIFSAYAPANGDLSTPGTIKYIWGTNPAPNNNAWPSEAWSGLDFYSKTLIPGWKKTLTAAGLKWGRLIRMKLNSSGNALTPFATGTGVNEDTVTYFQSINRYRDLAFAPNGKDIFIIMDNNSATSGPGVGNPIVPGCPGCVIKYSFLGYVADGSTSFGGSTIPKSIPVTDGTANTCNTGTTVTIDATNNNLWVPITGPDGNIMAEINAMGQNLGVVTSSFYKNSGSIRVKGGVHYLDRNITITPAVNGPYGTNVKVRFYISKAEFDALDIDPLSGIADISSLKVLKNDDPCGSAIATSTTMYTPTNTGVSPFINLQHGSNSYVYQVDIPKFSTFYFASSNVTLPVNLITFTGSLQNNTTTLLKWKTENEINTSIFLVERSIDGNTFTNIGSVAAGGNSSSILNYSFTDNDAANQQSLVLYYRLKMVDIDGSNKYSSVITIYLADIVGKVTVSPNPVGSEAKVTITTAQPGKIHLKLTDNTGRVLILSTLKVKAGNNSTLINTERLTTGVYYVSVEGAGLNQQIKLLKIK